MPALVIELQVDALNKDVSCADLLRKALVVSKKLGLKEIDQWLNFELNGYPPDDSLFPGYREVRGEVKVFNPYRGWQPLIFESPKEAEYVSKRKISQTIGELDSLIEGSDSENMHVPYPPAVKKRLMDSMELPLEPVLQVSKSSVVKILEAVRNTILEWSLKLENEGVLGEGMTFSGNERKAAAQATYVITNNIGSMQNSQIQQASAGADQKINIDNDISAISRFLAELLEQRDALGFEPQVTSELDAEISTVKSQIESPKPKIQIISPALKSIKSILEAAVGNATAQALLSQISNFI